jgi:hypothetical protein
VGSTSDMECREKDSHGCKVTCHVFLATGQE